MSRCPYFKFYTGDFHLGTAGFTAEEVGAYIRLLCYAWEHDGIEDDPGTIKRITGAKPKAISKVMQKFEKNRSNLWINCRQEDERKAVNEYLQKQSEKAQKRWKKDTNTLATAMPRDMPRHKPRDMQRESQPYSKPQPYKEDKKPFNPSPYNLGKIEEAIKAELKELENIHRAEVAGGGEVWDNQEKRLRHIYLKQKLKKVRDKNIENI